MLFLVLNYDDLLEQALMGFDPMYRYDVISDYISPERPAKVVKMHGSINWFRSLGDTEESWDDRVRATDVLVKPADGDILILNSALRVPDLRINRNLVYPVLTAPLASKGIADAVCPADHILFAESFLSSCHKFLVIGSSGWDEDLLGLLERSFPSGRVRFIQFIGQDTLPTKEALLRFAAIVPDFSFSELVTQFHDGFLNFMSGSSLRDFADMHV